MCRISVSVIVVIAAFASAIAHLRAETVTVAAAANFDPALRALRRAFEDISGHRLTIVRGSTGKLAAQILNGAPYDVFLAADAERPDRLVDAGAALAKGRFTYAYGRLALWSVTGGVSLEAGGEYLRTGRFRHLAIANPDLAPYGRAAWQVLAGLGVKDTVSAKLVRAESVGQTFGIVAAGAAELGFVALSQLMHADWRTRGRYWLIPETLHDPIRQDAVLLTRSAQHAGAVDLMTFLRSDAAKTIIERFGYRTED